MTFLTACLCLALALSPADEDRELEGLNELMGCLEHVQVERRGDALVVTGWTGTKEEQELLKRILAARPNLLDLTTADIADPGRMIEVDVIIVVVRDFARQSVGFDFLSLVNLRYDAFLTDHKRDGFGFQTPATVGAVTDATQVGHLLSASVDYDVNIANARNEEVSVLARPHLVTLNGKPAEFQSGGELVFQVSGIENGDIKPYPYGIQLNVTPTLLKTRTAEGTEQVLVEVEAIRTSILGLAFAEASVGGSDDVSFDKTRVKSTAILALDETLILSGLYQREFRDRRAGVPLLKDIPLLGALFGNETEVDDVQSTVILLTPRDPGLIDERRNEEIASFIERRRAYVKAREAGGAEIDRFKQEYPDWYQPRPNRYASHIFLLNNSSIYRQVSGDDLRTDALESGLWITDTAREAKDRRKDG
ncbi:MAG: type II and III secretion system protein [Planctomycetota bacterium]